MNPALKKIYPSAGFPKHWFGETFDDYTNMVASKKDKIVKVLQNLPEQPIKVMIYGPAAPIVTELLEGGRFLSNVRGVDFSSYFKKSFNKEAVVMASSSIDVVVIYNVGLEPAINTAYSQKLLKGLVSEYRNCDAHVFIQTDLDRVFFETNYDVRLASRISVKPLEDENVFA